MKKVYVIVDGYDYESDSVEAVFSTKIKAQKHLDEWEAEYREEYGIEESVKLPFGYKFGTHYRFAQEYIVDGEK